MDNLKGDKQQYCGTYGAPYGIRQTRGGEGPEQTEGGTTKSGIPT